MYRYTELFHVGVRGVNSGAQSCMVNTLLTEQSSQPLVLVLISIPPGTTDDNCTFLYLLNIWIFSLANVCLNLSLPFFIGLFVFLPLICRDSYAFLNQAVPAVCVANGLFTSGTCLASLFCSI